MSESFDLIIVGTGGGAMCAALVLQKAGKRVLMLEKASLVGGTTATSGGVMWIPNNRFMQQEGIPDSREDAITYLDAVVGDSEATPGASSERRSTFVDEAPRMIDFLVAQGIKLRRIPSWPDYYAVPGASDPGRTVVSQLFDLRQLGEWQQKLRPGFLPLPANLDEAMQLPLMKRTWGAKKVLARILGRAIADKFTGKKRTTAGQALQGQMLKAVLDAGVDIRTESAVTELLISNGRVNGVVANQNGQATTYAAKLGVLIAAGGFARNQSMLDRYMPGVSADWSLVIPEDTGDMIQAGERIGAATAQMTARIGMPVVLPPNNPPQPPAIQNDLAKPHTIVVTQNGQRFANEANSSIEFCSKMRELDAVPCWMIFDSQFISTHMLAGTMAGAKKPQAWYDSQFLRKADTLQELATLCDIEPPALTATVERFNQFVANGRDEDFQRGESTYSQWLGDPLNTPSTTLGSISEGPYYALQVFPGDVSTFGGLLTDTRARVLRADGSIIDGLYATGTSTASCLGQAEPGAGGSIGPAFTWGFIAANHILGEFN